MANIEKRTSGTGKISYRVKVRLKGHPYQTASFDRLTDAKRWAQSTEAAIREGRHFRTVEAKRHTLSELIDRYIRDVLPHKGSNAKQIKIQTTQLLWWKEQLGAYSLADISPARIGEMRDHFLAEPSQAGKKRSGATANRYLAILSHAFTIATKEWGWCDENPVSKVIRPRESRGRTRFLSNAERKRLLEACQKDENKYLYTIVVVALSTGARQGEILNLTWRDVDFSRRVITLHETKNGEIRLLPLVGHALSLIEDLAAKRRNDTDLVFPNRRGNRPTDVRSAFLRAIEAAEIEDFRFHDLRHSAASYFAMNGASLAEIAEVLGHKTLQMVKRYAHLSEAHTSKVVESMNARIFE